MPITYMQRASLISVLLDGKSVGAIHSRMTKNGILYQYVPKGKTGRDGGGELFPTLEGCKQSLESE